MLCIDWNSPAGKRVLADLLRFKAKQPVRKSLGWVNLYRNTYGHFQISGIPKPTKAKALSSRAGHPVSTYIDTIELFAEVQHD